MSELRRLVAHQHQAFNAREFDALREIFAPDVEMIVDGARFHGVDAVLDYTATMLRGFPGIRIENDRVVSEGGDTIVVEADLVDGSGGSPRGEGALCELWRVAEGRIVGGHSYYAAFDPARTTPGSAPWQEAAARVAEEQGALRRVATLVARGVSREELLAAVNEEIARLVAADPVAMARFESDDTVTVVAGSSAGGAEFPIGERRPLDPLLRSVRDTGRPTRFIPADLPPTGWIIAEGRENRIQSSVAVPITVDGRVWGVTFACTTRPEPFPEDTEARITSFTELVGTAIANAHVRAELTRLADEQAALRRVAELVARGVEPEQLFAVVAEELCKLFGGTALMFRYEPDDMSLCVAAWQESGESDLVGFRARAPEGGLLAQVRRTGRPGRIDDYRVPLGEFAERTRHVPIRCAAGGPITVEGRPWGLVCAVFPDPEPAPPDIELRIARFAELASTAIANAQARAELRTLVEEQRGLRRVATLVARGAPQADVFDAVAIEASRLLGGKSTALLRFDPDGDATMVAVCGGLGTVGMRVPTAGESITSQVWRTRRPARLDSYDGVPGGDIARDHGVTAGVGAPIAVEGRLWGLVLALSTDEPLPAAAEDRVAQFAELVAAAIGNAASRAELTASRARVVATADETRWRIQRDVHDGAQQRLVHTVITLKLAEDALGPNAGPVAELVAEALEQAERATAELRELAHGVLPAALTRGGLLAGIESLVGSVDLPVTVEAPTERLPPALETAAYFIVAEALTNVIKHAGAESAQVRAVVDGGMLRLEVRDDGSGGADLTRGSGLVGLTDRVGALGGTITVTSPPGEGTTVAVALPIEQRSAISTG